MSLWPLKRLKKRVRVCQQKAPSSERRTVNDSPSDAGREPAVGLGRSGGGLLLLSGDSGSLDLEPYSQFRASWGVGAQTARNGRATNGSSGLGSGRNLGDGLTVGT